MKDDAGRIILLCMSWEDNYLDLLPGVTQKTNKLHTWEYFCTLNIAADRLEGGNMSVDETSIILGGKYSPFERVSDIGAPGDSQDLNRRYCKWDQTSCRT